MKMKKEEKTVRNTVIVLKEGPTTSGTVIDAKITS